MLEHEPGRPVPTDDEQEVMALIVMIPTKVDQLVWIISGSLGEQGPEVVIGQPIPALAAGHFASTPGSPLHELLGRHRDGAGLRGSSLGGRADDLRITSGHRADPGMDFDALPSALGPGPITPFADGNGHLKRRTAIIRQRAESFLNQPRERLIVLHLGHFSARLEGIHELTKSHVLVG